MRIVRDFIEFQVDLQDLNYSQEIISSYKLLLETVPTGILIRFHNRK